MEEQPSYLDGISNNENEPPVYKRLLITVTDTVIAFTLLVLFYIWAPVGLLGSVGAENDYWKYIIAFIFIFGYRFILIFLAGRTVGMMLFKVKYLNKDLQPLNTKEKLSATFSTRTPTIRYYKE